MARLSDNTSWLIQQEDGLVRVFNENTNEQIVAFNPSNANQTARAQKIIHDSTSLSDEEKCFAHFLSGYFHAHAK